MIKVKIFIYILLFLNIINIQYTIIISIWYQMIICHYPSLSFSYVGKYLHYRPNIYTNVTNISHINSSQLSYQNVMFIFLGGGKVIVYGLYIVYAKHVIKLLRFSRSTRYIDHHPIFFHAI